jgi:hypothetical protein
MFQKSLLKCPITKEYMLDPVMCSDGVTYEREAIERWLKENSGSPITREKLDVSRIVSNKFARDLIREYLTQRTLMKLDHCIMKIKSQ